MFRGGFELLGEFQFTSVTDGLSLLPVAGSHAGLLCLQRWPLSQGYITLYTPNYLRAARDAGLSPLISNAPIVTTLNTPPLSPLDCQWWH